MNPNLPMFVTVILIVIWMGVIGYMISISNSSNNTKPKPLNDNIVTVCLNDSPFMFQNGVIIGIKTDSQGIIESCKPETILPS